MNTDTTELFNQLRVIVSEITELEFTLCNHPDAVARYKALSDLEEKYYEKLKIQDKILEIWKIQFKQPRPFWKKLFRK